MRFELGDFGFEPAYGLGEIRNAPDGGAIPEPFAVLHGGIAGIERTRRHVVGYPALRRDHGGVAHRQVSRAAHLPPENAALADFGAAGEPYLPTEQAIFAHAAAVADEHQVVELGAIRDAGFAHGGAVHAGVRL